MADKDDEQRLLQERRELLKLKQGIIEESDIIQRDEPEDIPRPTGIKTVENFFYHYKWYVVLIAFFTIVFGYMIVQAVTREKPDLNVAVISSAAESGIYPKLNDIERTLEKYCHDFDGNGNVHVQVNFIDLNTSSGNIEYIDTNRQKFQSIELFGGESQMWLCDYGVIEELYSAYEKIDFFVDFSGEYPDAKLIDDRGLVLNDTDFTEYARWSTCPDDVAVYVREVFENMTGNSKQAQEQRERALTVYRNLASGIVVNEEATEES